MIFEMIERWQERRRIRDWRDVTKRAAFVAAKAGEADYRPGPGFEWDGYRYQDDVICINCSIDSFQKRAIGFIVTITLNTADDLLVFKGECAGDVSSGINRLSVYRAGQWQQHLCDLEQSILPQQQSERSTAFTPLDKRKRK